MIKIKTEKEIELMRIAGRITRDTLNLLKEHSKPNISTAELDKIAYDYIISQGAKPSFKHYQGFPASICASINEEVVHGIPSKNRILKEGDILSVDVGACYEGYHGDAARTFAIGKIDAKKKKLIKVTEECFFEGIKGIKAGNFVGDISHKVQLHAEKNGYGVVRELIGHGVGRELHEEPNVPNYGVAGSGPKLNAGAVIAVEPMITMGKRHVVFDESNGWTVSTKDGLPAAHYENTILITPEGVEILTL